MNRNKEMDQPFEPVHPFGALHKVAPCFVSGRVALAASARTTPSGEKLEGVWAAI